MNFLNLFHSIMTVQLDCMRLSTRKKMFPRYLHSVLLVLVSLQLKGKFLCGSECVYTIIICKDFNHACRLHNKWYRSKLNDQIINNFLCSIAWNTRKFTTTQFCFQKFYGQNYRYCIIAVFELRFFSYTWCDAPCIDSFRLTVLQKGLKTLAYLAGHYFKGGGQCQMSDHFPYIYRPNTFSLVYFLFYWRKQRAAFDGNKWRTFILPNKFISSL